ncbi:hypothetical protein CICLE_v10017996mg, partial [Citrus x clementina]
GKENYLTDEPLASESKDYRKWLQEDTMVTTWLWNSMDPLVAAKMQERFGQSKNSSRIYELYEAFFSCQQGDKSLSKHYGILEGLWGELTFYHPLTTDIAILERQHKKLLVVRFLSSLNPVYESLKNGILTEKELPNIKEAYACLKQLPSTY